MSFGGGLRLCYVGVYEGEVWGKVGRVGIQRHMLITTPQALEGNLSAQSLTVLHSIFPLCPPAPLHSQSDRHPPLIPLYRQAERSFQLPRIHQGEHGSFLLSSFSPSGCLGIPQKGIKHIHEDQQGSLGM